MQALNIALFQWMAAGYSPNTQLLRIALWVAVNGALVCVPVMGWVAWRCPRQRTYLLFALVAAGVAALAAHAVAGALRVPRPFVAGLSPNYIQHGARGALPSAHASVVFALAWLFLLRPALRRAGGVLFAVAVAVGWARIYVGVHYPLDICAGLLLGALIAAVFWRLAVFFQSVSWPESRLPARQLAAGDAGAAVAQARVPRSISCVLPCFNEAENLERLLPLLRARLVSLAPRWEIVLVDDGSTDATGARLPDWTRQAGVRALRLSRNFGKEAALTAGLQAAKGELIVIMDADMQHPLALLDTFVQRWSAGADVVYAVRANRAAESHFKRVGARWFYGLLNHGGRFKVPADAGDFRLVDRVVVQALLALPERNRFMKGLYAWVGFDAVAVSYVPDERAHGVSHFGKLRLLQMALDGLTAFTVWPLQAVVLLGFALALGAFGYGAYLIAMYLRYGHSVSGWTTIVVSLMLFAGMQLISLGVVGEYVGRVYEEVKRRPLFLIQRELGQGIPEDG
jgi:glycosyltransferase involved in cell wall biosynthesis/membrane-associated phospholipid phosphatase